MASLISSPYPRELELRICQAIRAQRLLEFDYSGYHRVVQPYCHGFTSKGAESLRAVQVNADSRSGGRAFGFGKLWTVAKIQNLRIAPATFDADDPDYNPNDTAMPEIHCRVERAPHPRHRWPARAT
jgi:hypothetical protein